MNLVHSGNTCPPPCFPRPSYPVQPVPIPVLIVLPSNFPSFIYFLTLFCELQGIRKRERRLNSMVVKNKKALESEIQPPPARYSSCVTKSNLLHLSKLRSPYTGEGNTYPTGCEGDTEQGHAQAVLRPVAARSEALAALRAGQLLLLQSSDTVARCSVRHTL